ncbi:MAG: hypothetical protein NT176_04120 [Proteobacteria bacterium]|nr:hypothetical protein [Pseudomonadota bacterium]
MDVGGVALRILLHQADGPAVRPRKHLEARQRRAHAGMVGGQGFLARAEPGALGHLVAKARTLALRFFVAQGLQAQAVFVGKFAQRRHSRALGAKEAVHVRQAAAFDLLAAGKAQGLARCLVRLEHEGRQTAHSPQLTVEHGQQRLHQFGFLQ